MTNEWIFPFWLDRLQEEIVRASVVATFLLACVWCARTLFRSWLPARLVYLLSVIVLIRFLTPSTPLKVDPDSFLNFAPAKPAPEIATHESRASDSPHNLPLASSQGPMPIAITKDLKPTPVSKAEPTFVYLRWVGDFIQQVFWIALLPVGLLIFLRRYKDWLSLRAWIQKADVVDLSRYSELNRVLEATRAELGVGFTVTVKSSKSAATAFLIGCFRPTLVLPERFLHSDKRQELRWILLHELSHRKALDPWVNVLSLCALSLHWFNPFAWWFVRDLKRRQEIACDAEIISHLNGSERKQYAALLLEGALEQAEPSPNAILSPAICFHSEVETRIRAIARHKKPGKSGILAGTLILFMTAAMAMVDPENQEKIDIHASKLEPGKTNVLATANDNANDLNPTKLELELLNQNAVIKQIEFLENEMNTLVKRDEMIRSDLRNVRMELKTKHSKDRASLKEEEANLLRKLAVSREIIRLVPQKWSETLFFKAPDKSAIDLLEEELGKRDQVVEQLEEKLSKLQTRIDENSDLTQKNLLQSKDALTRKLYLTKVIRDAIKLRLIQEKLEHNRRIRDMLLFREKVDLNLPLHNFREGDLNDEAEEFLPSLGQY